MDKFGNGSFMNKQEECNGVNHKWLYETPLFRYCQTCGKQEMFDGQKRVWVKVLNEG